MSCGLQKMQTYINVSNFEYMKDRTGKTYGWGMARYTTPEAQFGGEIIETAYREESADSAKRIAAYLGVLLPDASEKQILKILG